MADEQVPVLERPVFMRGRDKPFRELTAEEVSERAAELRGAAGFGHGGRVGAVAMGWAELAAEMRRSEAASVGELDPAVAEEFAGRVWVVPPGGSLLP